ncbi:hypothetical protein Hte_007445 [Hypoxylon texense]
MFADNHSPSAPSHNYDKNTGQTFKEWVVRPSKPDEVEWHRTTEEFIPSVSPKSSGEKGARGLVDIAIRVAAENLSFLEVGDLEHVPATMIHRIWRYIRNNRLPVPLQSFKILVRHLEPRPLPPSLCKRDYKVLQTTGPLSTYMNPLKSSSFEFLVHLTITGHHPSIDTHQLLALTELKNLGVLEILQPVPSPDGTDNFPRVSDAIIRQWSQEPDPFPVLRIMRIWGNDFTTRRSLQYLSKFPALAVYDVAGNERDWNHLRPVPGWTSQPRSWRNRDGVFQTVFNCLPLLRADAVYHPDWHMDFGILERWGNLFWTFTSTEDDSEVKIIDRDDVPTALPPGYKHVEDFKKRTGTNTNTNTNTDHANASTSSSNASTKNTDTNKKKKKEQTLFTLWKERIGFMETNTTFQSWGYILYTHIGQLRSNRDLAAAAAAAPQNGVLPDADTDTDADAIAIAIAIRDKAVLVDPGAVVPPRPFVSLQLGSCCRNRRPGVGCGGCCSTGTSRRFQTYLTFARAEFGDPKEREKEKEKGLEIRIRTRTEIPSGGGSGSSSLKRPRPHEGGESTAVLPIRKKQKMTFPIDEIRSRGSGSGSNSSGSNSNSNSSGLKRARPYEGGEGGESTAIPSIRKRRKVMFPTDEIRRHDKFRPKGR